MRHCSYRLQNSSIDTGGFTLALLIIIRCGYPINAILAVLIVCWSLRHYFSFNFLRSRNLAAILSPKRVEALAIEAKKYGLEVLLELHDENELGHICNEVDMVGINNRNLKTFEVDIQHSIKLAKQLPADKVKIAESGIDDIETIKIFKDAGFKGFLIGEKFMKEPHPGNAFEQFVQKLKQG